MLARIIDNQVVEYRDIGMADVPEHKRYLWRPIVVEGEGSQENVQVEPDRVLITRSNPAPDKSLVNSELKRRLSIGIYYDFEDERGVHEIGTTPIDLEGWREVTDLANAYANHGQDDAEISIETNTGTAQVTPDEWQAVALEIQLARQKVYQKSFALMKMNPIPEDYADDSYWT